MIKFLTKILAVVFSLILFFVLFFTSIEVVVYNLPYFQWHYENRDIDQDTLMSIDDLMEVTEKMVDYLKDDRENLDMQVEIDGEVQEVFGEREKSHMVDVKMLAIAIHNFEIVGAILVFIFASILYLLNRRMLIQCLSTAKYVFATSMAFILAIGALLVVNFEKYFIIFHELFFDNDLWLLDPNTDILINMVPEIFFFTTAMLVIVVFALFSAALIFGLEMIKKKLIKMLG